MKEPDSRYIHSLSKLQTVCWAGRCGDFLDSFADECSTQLRRPRSHSLKPRTGVPNPRARGRFHFSHPACRTRICVCQCPTYLSRDTLLTQQRPYAIDCVVGLSDPSNAAWVPKVSAQLSGTFTASTTSWFAADPESFPLTPAYVRSIATSGIALLSKAGERAYIPVIAQSGLFITPR